MTERDPPNNGSNGERPGDFPQARDRLGEGEGVGARLKGSQTAFDSAIPDPGAMPTDPQRPEQTRPADARRQQSAPESWEFLPEATPARLFQARERARSDGADLVIVALIGFSGTGKSFIIRRLLNSLETARHRDQTHTAYTLDNFPIISLDTWLDRTRFYSGFWLKPDGAKGRQRQYLVLDLPGEQFNTVIGSWGVSLGERPTSAASDEMIAGIGGALAFADAIVFTAPALQLLDPERYLRDGDVEGDEAPARRLRADDHAYLLRSMQVLRDVVAPWRQLVREATSATGLDRAIVARFRAARDRHPRPLDLPARLMLTRGDEYLATLAPEDRATFDKDPLAHIAGRRPEAIERLANQFVDCAWDFATPCAAAESRNFDPNRPHHGVARLLEWVDSAVDASRLRRAKGWDLLRPTTHDALRVMALRAPPSTGRRLRPSALPCRAPSIARCARYRLCSAPFWSARRSFF